MIAALYVESRGVYAGLPDVDLRDRDRDARTYAGPWPVVAHPPCARWGRSWGGNPTQHSRGSSWETTRDASPRPWTRCDGTAVYWSNPKASPAWTGLRTPHATESRRVVVTAWQGEWTCCVEKDTTGTAPARPHGGHPRAACAAVDRRAHRHRRRGVLIMSCATGPCSHPLGESKCPVCRWLSAPMHGQSGQPLPKTAGERPKSLRRGAPRTRKRSREFLDKT